MKCLVVCKKEGAKKKFKKYLTYIETFTNFVIIIRNTMKTINIHNVISSKPQGNCWYRGMFYTFFGSVVESW
jgi:hypothetical protein